MHRNMKATHWLVVLGAVAMLCSACGSTHELARNTTAASPSVWHFTTNPVTQPGTTVASGARQPNQCQPVVPAPTFALAAPSSRSLAIVWLTGGSKPVVRDISDINHPSTVGTLDVPSRFVSASDIAYVDADGNLIRLAYASSAKVTVARC